mgnify:CR=1 FL=1
MNQAHDFSHPERSRARVKPPPWHPRRVHFTRVHRGVTACFDACGRHEGGGVLYDYGCGGMPYRGELEPRLARYVGIDLPDNPLAEVTVDAIGDVGLPDGEADVLLSTQVLEHVPDPHAYLREAHRLLKPGGSLILSTHGLFKHHPDPADYWRWTESGLALQLQRAGFEVVRSERDFGLMSAGLYLVQDSALRALRWRSLRVLPALLFQSLVALTSRLERLKRSGDAMTWIVLARRVEPPRGEG